MSLIVCGQDCRHQSDGYCALNQITSLSGSSKAKCGYYEKLDANTKYTQHPETPSVKNTKGFR